MTLKISNAVAAIIEVEDREYFFKKVDNKKIFGTQINWVFLEEVLRMENHQLMD